LATIVVDPKEQRTCLDGSQDARRRPSGVALAQSIEVIGEPRIRRRHASDIFDEAVALTTGRQHGRSHGDAMIATR